MYSHLHQHRFFHHSVQEDCLTKISSFSNCKLFKTILEKAIIKIQTGQMFLASFNSLCGFYSWQLHCCSVSPVSLTLFLDAAGSCFQQHVSNCTLPAAKHWVCSALEQKYFSQELLETKAGIKVDWMLDSGGHKHKCQGWTKIKNLPWFYAQTGPPLLAARHQTFFSLPCTTGQLINVRYIIPKKLYYTLTQFKKHVFLFTSTNLFPQIRHTFTGTPFIGKRFGKTELAWNTCFYFLYFPKNVPPDFICYKQNLHFMQITNSSMTTKPLPYLKYWAKSVLGVLLFSGWLTQVEINTRLQKSINIFIKKFTVVYVQLI